MVKKAENQVAETKEQLPVTAESSAELDALFGAQTEGADVDSFAIPFIKIIQSESPQMKPTKAEYNEDARPGMIINTVTQGLMKEVVILPVTFEREFLEWGPKQGDGLKGRHGVTAEKVLMAETDDRQRRITDEGNILADTRNHYVLVIRDGTATPALLPMASTQIKKSKALMTQIQEAGKAKKLLTYTLSTGPESNDSGDWYGWVIGSSNDVSGDQDLVAEAVKFMKAIKGGQVVVDESEFGTGGSSNGDEAEEEIPFV